MYCSQWHQQLILAKKQTTACANYSMMIMYNYTMIYLSEKGKSDSK